MSRREPSARSILRVGGVAALVASCAPGGVDPPVEQNVAAIVCSSATDPCDDGNVCTTDSCDVPSGMCRHRTVAGCCRSSDDCEDVNVCTENLCLDNVCSYRAILGCRPMDTDDAGRERDAASPPDASGPGPSVPDAGDDSGRPGVPAEGDGAVHGASDGGTAPDDAGGDAQMPAIDNLDVRGGACSAARGPAGTQPQIGWAAVLLVGLWRLVRRRAAALAVALLWLVMGPAYAQAEGFRLDRHHPPGLPEDLMWLERPAQPQTRHSAFGRLSLGFADDPLVLGGERVERAIVAEQLAVHMSLGVSLWRRLHLVLGLPYWNQRGGRAATISERRLFSNQRSAFGDPSVDVRASLLQADAPVELALAVSGTVPVGEAQALAADSRWTLHPRAALAVPLRSSASFVGVNAGVRLRPEARLGRLRLGDELTFAAGGQFGVRRAVAVTAEIAGSTVLARAFDPRHTPLELCLGVRYQQPRSGLTVALGLGAGISPGYGAPDARAVASLSQRLPWGGDRGGA